MGREIILWAMSYCSRSRFLYSAVTSYVFCRVIKFFKFSAAFFVSGLEECLQYASQTCEACEA